MNSVAHLAETPPLPLETEPVDSLDVAAEQPQQEAVTLAKTEIAPVPGSLADEQAHIQSRIFAGEEPDYTAFGECFMSQFAPRLRTLFILKSMSREEIEDTLQEVYIKAHKKSRHSQMAVQDSFHGLLPSQKIPH